MMIKFTSNTFPKTIYLQIQRFLGSKEMMDREYKYSAHNYKPIPVVLCEGNGVFVWDVEGKRYYDFLSGFAANNFGHCNPKLIRALKKQAETLHHTSRAFHHNLLGEYSQFITQLFGYDKVLPMNSGVEADESAVKLARKWGYLKKNIPKDKAVVLFAKNNFWGRTLAAVTTSADPKAYEGYGPFVPGFTIIPYNDLGSLEEAAKNPNVCGFMVEPIQGEAGIVIPKDGYLRGVREICSKYKVLWIDDEIQTGLGRTGRTIAVDYEDVKPDILVLGKALGGGMYPVSACLANDDVMLVMEPGTHGSTFGGNPLGCRVAMTVLNIILEENVVENSCKMGELMRKGLKDLQSPKILEVRGKGLMNAIVIDSKQIKARDLCLKFKENGLLAKDARDDVVRFTPPLIITEEQICEGVEIIKKSLDRSC